MQKRVLLITGGPGVGKTTVLLKTVDLLKVKGFSVGGMLSRDMRSGTTRAGFEVMDLYTGKTGQLAHKDLKSGPQVGKYHVNIADLDAIGTEAVGWANKKCDVVAVDEIGPMELLSDKFRHAVTDAVDSQKLIIGTIHWKAGDNLVKEIKTREDAVIFVVTWENRSSLPSAIASEADKYLSVTELE